MMTAYSFPQIITNVHDFFFRHYILVQDASALPEFTFNLVMRNNDFHRPHLQSLNRKIKRRKRQSNSSWYWEHILKWNIAQGYPTKINVWNKNANRCGQGFVGPKDNGQSGHPKVWLKHLKIFWPPSFWPVFGIPFITAEGGRHLPPSPAIQMAPVTANGRFPVGFIKRLTVSDAHNCSPFYIF